MLVILNIKTNFELYLETACKVQPLDITDIHYLRTL